MAFAKARQAEEEEDVGNEAQIPQEALGYSEGPRFAAGTGVPLPCTAAARGMSQDP